MKIVNKKFHHDYEKIESLEAGIVLTGGEVKSIREGRLRLEDSYVKFLDDGAYLINAEIPPYRFAQNQNYDPKRSRKLLLNKKEIIRLKTKLKSAKSLTVVPVSCYNKGNLLKLEIALARGRKEIEKRKLEKQREIEREKEKELKEWVKTEKY
jgi:SsrA-binding protein